MRYLKLFEELNRETYMSASNELNNYGFEDRAIRLSHHMWERYIAENYNDYDKIRLDVDGEIVEFYPLISLFTNTNKQLWFEVYAFFDDVQFYKKIKQKNSYSSILPIMDIKIVKYNNINVEVSKNIGEVIDKDLLYKYILDVYSGKRKQIYLYSGDYYSEELDFIQNPDEIFNVIKDHIQPSIL